ncbi:MAG TPA: gliding motility-associated C-terminal domain-containing protein [Saprospiraceae bacterium]|mgnify:CR=1 FL=1|nr:gliding motility-associated C-terminal domain-containing protein [Saprospiraceae bacterium]HPN69643.1 gliding motility-associated C-terminal domain-containing protein [Saprospiraceae bacterium]
MSKNKVTTLFFLSAFFWVATCLPAQDISSNEECRFAYNINDVSDFCSDSLDFSNLTANVSSVDNPSCWPDSDPPTDRDVWFSFRPDKTSMLIRVFGSGSFAGKTMVKPQFGLYTGTCGNLINEGCSSVLTGANYIEFLVSDVVIGRKYFLRIAARDGGVGSFRLCINTFPQLKKAESDCVRGNILCDKTPYSLENLQDVGAERNEVAASCIQEEFASVWLKWIIKDPGSLTFTVFPNNNSDDLDWALYVLPGGLQDCANKRLVRCNAAGESVGRGPAYNAPCMGPTGLSTKSTDLTEAPGCDNGNDNFVAAVDAKEGEVYALIVNNFSRSGNGFTLRFGGTSTFQGPDIDLDISAINKIECDKSVILENKIVTQVDSIIKYNWSFGEGANIQTATTSGPHSVIYDSFGDKVASLSVESQRGCIVTKALNFYVEPCCADLVPINSEISLTEPVRCPGEKNAAVMITSRNAAEPTQYAIINGNFQLNPTFKGLGEGAVTIAVEDAKGCKDTASFIVPDAVDIDVELGEEINVTAGTSVNLQPLLSPPSLDFTWNIVTSCRLENFEEGNLSQNFMPYGISTLILTGSSANGCTTSDTLVINASSNNTLYYPNIISANNDGLNDIFSISNEDARTEISELSIFDRWGNMVYTSTNLVVNDKSIGWNGTFNQAVLPGVYVWVAKVKYIDCEEKIIHGDVTVVK